MSLGSSQLSSLLSFNQTIFTLFKENNQINGGGSELANKKSWMNKKNEVESNWKIWWNGISSR